MELPSGVVTGYTYDSDGRLEQLRTLQGGGEKLDLQFTHDGAGRVLTLVEEGTHLASTVNHSWTYNKRSQLRELAPTDPPPSGSPTS